MLGSLTIALLAAGLAMACTGASPREHPGTLSPPAKPGVLTLVPSDLGREQWLLINDSADPVLADYFLGFWGRIERQDVSGTWWPDLTPREAVVRAASDAVAPAVLGSKQRRLVAPAPRATAQRQSGHYRFVLQVRTTQGEKVLQSEYRVRGLGPEQSRKARAVDLPRALLPIGRDWAQRARHPGARRHQVG